MPDVDELPLNKSSQRSTVLTALQTLSALPNLQYLQLNLDLVKDWSTFYDAETIGDRDLLSILKAYKPWDSIRFLYMARSGSYSFIQEMLKSHLPNLIGLATAEYSIWETQKGEQQSSQLAEGIESRLGSLSNLKRLILAPNHYGEPLPLRIEGFTFDVASLKRVSETFKKLEWLYIGALGDCAKPCCWPRRVLTTDHMLKLGSDLESCYECLGQMPSLKRVALSVFFHNCDEDHPEEYQPSGKCPRRVESMTRLANMILEKVPNLEQVCLVLPDRWMELDRKKAPKGIRWVEHPLCSTPKPQVFVPDYSRLVNLDAYSEVWPLGLRDGSYEEMCPTRASKFNY